MNTAVSPFAGHGDENVIVPAPVWPFDVVTVPLGPIRVHENENVTAPLTSEKNCALPAADASGQPFDVVNDSVPGPENEPYAWQLPCPWPTPTRVVYVSTQVAAPTFGAACAGATRPSASANDGQDGTHGGLLTA